MAGFRSRPQGDGQQLVLYWSASPSTRCVLVTAHDAVDLQLIRDGVVERQASDVDPRMARDLARQWQMEHEIARRSTVPPSAVCSECGDEAPLTYVMDHGIERRLCYSCGHEWSVGAKAGR
jgi:Zn ribbon nucleic-acid-binding protein